MKLYKFLMLALLSISLVACTEESDKTISDPVKEDVKEDSTKKDDKFTYNEGKIGERVIHAEKLAVTITNVEFFNEKPENIVLPNNEEQLPEGSKLVLITAIQENVSKEQQFIADSTVKILDNEGFEYTSITATYIGEDSYGGFGQPKIPATTKTAIVVPESFDENDYIIHFYEWSDNVKTVLTK